MNEDNKDALVGYGMAMIATVVAVMLVLGLI